MSIRTAPRSAVISAWRSMMRLAVLSSTAPQYRERIGLASHSSGYPLSKADTSATELSGAMILDATLNHALHVGIVRLHVDVAIVSPLFQALRTSLGGLSHAALASALFDAHPRVASRSVSSCREPR